MGDGYCHARLLGRKGFDQLALQCELEYVSKAPHHNYCASFQ